MHNAEIRELAKRSIDRVLSGEEFTEIQQQLGYELFYEFNWNPLFQGKEVVGATVFVSDISNRKLIEQKFIESKAELRNMLKLSDQSRQTLLSVLEDQRETEKEIKRINAELEQRVIERTAQLEDANKELESFSYSIAHDLRAPLRAIDGFSKFLYDDYKDKIDDEGKDLINIIRENTERMGQLITDLLQLSRISRNQLNLTLVDMEELVRTVYAEIFQQGKDDSYTLIVEEMPKVYADLNLIKIVWTNLFGNAVKYSRKKKKKRIIVSTEITKKSITFYVKDNGVGFNADYKHKLFGVFQRLHSLEEFEGTGVGLVIVKRIIDKHGGKVWADGELDKGATFYFSLNKESDSIIQA